MDTLVVFFFFHSDFKILRPIENSLFFDDQPMFVCCYVKIEDENEHKPTEEKEGKDERHWQVNLGKQVKRNSIKILEYCRYFSFLFFLQGKKTVAIDAQTAFDKLSMRGEVKNCLALSLDRCSFSSIIDIETQWWRGDIEREWEWG